MKTFLVSIALLFLLGVISPVALADAPSSRMQGTTYEMVERLDHWNTEKVVAEAVVDENGVAVFPEPQYYSTAGFAHSIFENAVETTAWFTASRNEYFSVNPNDRLNNSGLGAGWVEVDYHYSADLSTTVRFYIDGWGRTYILREKIRMVDGQEVN